MESCSLDSAGSRFEEHHGKGCWAASGGRLGGRLRQRIHMLVPGLVAAAVLSKLCSAESLSQKVLKKAVSMIKQFGKLYLVHFSFKDAQ